MKNIFLIIILLSILKITYSQVETRYNPNGDIEKNIKHIKKCSEIEKIKKLPQFNIEKLIEKDKLDEGKDIPLRFGKGFDVNLSLSDGEWEEFDNGRIWSIRIQSDGAYSINFIFDPLYLSENAELYISNLDGTMLFGPVTSMQNTKDGFFLTDLIAGDDVAIYLYEPQDEIGKSKLEIKRIVHAYKNLFPNLYGNLGGSLDCNNNIACSPLWDLESDAVALVLLSSGTEWCSGSLLMTTNSDFRPYFLSAFHCVNIEVIDNQFDDILSENEINNAERWMFKYQYKMTTCEGNIATTGITYNGAEYRSAWGASDFALMEMDISPVGDTRFSWLGWDISNEIPTSGTCIHHPAGDVMKISFDDWHLYSNTSQINWAGGGPTTPIGTHWVARLDNGTIQGGSSGAPLFDQNKRVIGQVHGGEPGCPPITKYFGKTYNSWTGNDTDETRLSNWLDPNDLGYTSTNTTRSPYISGTTSLCIFNTTTFTLNDRPSGTTVNWTKSDNMIYISGQETNNYTVKRSGLGSGWVQAEISGTNFNIVPIRKYYTDGSPIINDSQIRGGYDNVPFNNISTFYITAALGASSYLWSIVPYSMGCSSTQLPYFVSSNTGTSVTVKNGTCEGKYILRCIAINGCGTNYYQDKVINVYDPNGEDDPCDGILTLYPNPGKKDNFTKLRIQYPDDPCDDEIDPYFAFEAENELSVHDLSGNLVLQERFILDTYTFKNTDFKKNVYILTLKDKKGKIHQTRLTIK